MTTTAGFSTSTTPLTTTATTSPAQSHPNGTCRRLTSIRRTTSPASRDATKGPPPPPSQTGGHRGLPGFGGGHRNEAGRRGVSIGVVAALITVVVVVGVVILWRFFGDALSNRSHSARCVGERQPVAVIADPSITDQVQHLAERFNSIAAPVGDHCVSVGVKSAGSDAVVDGFIGKWPARAGPTTGAVDSRQLGIGRAADRRRGQGDRYRQPVAGHLAGGARGATGTSKSARRSEVGDAARSADQAGLVGGIEAAGVGFAAPGAATRRQQRRRIPRRRGGGGGIRAARCAADRRQRRGAHTDRRSAQARRQLAGRGDESAADIR